MGPSEGKSAASRAIQRQEGCTSCWFLCASAVRIQVSSHTATVCPPCPADEPYGISSCRKAEHWKGPGSAVLGHGWEASSTERLTTGTGEDPSHKLSSVLPEGLLKVAYSEQRCTGRLTAKELGSNESRNIRGSILSHSSWCTQREKPVLEKSKANRKCLTSTKLTYVYIKKKTSSYFSPHPFILNILSTNQSDSKLSPHLLGGIFCSFLHVFFVLLGSTEMKGYKLFLL